MTESVAHRLARVELALAQGNFPIIRRHLPGAYNIIVKWGLIPNVDLFVPDADFDNMSAKDKIRARSMFNWNRRYRMKREELGVYTPLEDRRKAAAMRNMNEIAQILSRINRNNN